MNHASSNQESYEAEQPPSESDRSSKPFKKLKRPMHATKRAGAPERLHGMHRRKRKRVEW